MAAMDNSLNQLQSLLTLIRQLPNSDNQSAILNLIEQLSLSAEQQCQQREQQAVQIIKMLSEKMLSLGLVDTETQEQFELIKQLAAQGHPLETLETLIKLQPDKPYSSADKSGSLDSLLEQSHRIQQQIGQLRKTADARQQWLEEPPSATDHSAENIFRQFGNTDALTGLTNLDGITSQFQQEASRHSRYGGSMSLAVLEIVQPEDFAERFGDDSYEQVLVFYARRLFRILRIVDMIARVEKDRFVVLFPHSDVQQAETALQRLLAKTHRSSLDTQTPEAKVKIPVFAAGLTQWQDLENFQTTLARAEEALQVLLQGDGSGVQRSRLQHEN